MGTHVVNRIIKPNQCVLGYGIPTTPEDFFSDQLNPNKKFAKRFEGVWPKYVHQIVNPINAIELKIKKYGVTVIHNLTLENFGELFNNKHFDVIILFSHWEDESVEFDDGLANVPTILNYIPNYFSGIIDLTICHPISLEETIIKNRPNCTIKITRKKATPFIWLYTYEALFWLLDREKLTYLDALEQVIKLMHSKSTK